MHHYIIVTSDGASVVKSQKPLEKVVGIVKKKLGGIQNLRRIGFATEEEVKHYLHVNNNIEIDVI